MLVYHLSNPTKTTLFYIHRREYESNVDDSNYQVRSWHHSSIPSQIKIYKSTKEEHWCTISPSLNRLFGKKTNFFYHGKEFNDVQFKRFVNKHEHRETNIHGYKPKPVNVQFTLDSNFSEVLKKTKHQLVNQFLSWVSSNDTSIAESSKYDVIELP